MSSSSLDVTHSWHPTRRAPTRAQRHLTPLVSGLGLAAWVLFTNLVGIVAALVTDSRSDWYMALEKPAFNPPSWVFAPVWTTLYVLMGVAAWRVWKKHGFGGAPVALGLFVAQLALNFVWSPVFFGAHDPGGALVVIGALWVALAATLGAFWRRDRAAGALLAPYLAWVSFATALNASIVALNPWS